MHGLQFTFFTLVFARLMPIGFCRSTILNNNTTELEEAFKQRDRSISHSSVNPEVIRKTVYSDKLRLVFFAGLEGTGHHYWHQANNLCLRKKWCTTKCELSLALYPGLATAPSLAEYDGAIEELEHSLDDLRRLEHEVAVGNSSESNGFGGLIIPVNAAPCPSSGMMSYPNFNGANKALQYVNIILLAQMSEEKGIDLRIVYLQRPSEDIISSDARRGFGGNLMTESRTLGVNANALSYMLSNIDSEFVECFNFVVTDDPEEFSRIAAFISPSKVIADGMTVVLNASYHPPRKDEGEKKYIYESTGGETTYPGSSNRREGLTSQHRFHEELWRSVRDAEARAHCRLPSTVPYFLQDLP
ncbi:unnamed protein product [Choristocarpus tenellus]